jgi:hypothetical protein
MKIYAKVLPLVLACSVQLRCGEHQETVAVGSHLPADLVVFFKPGTTGKEVNDFLEHTLPRYRDSAGNYRPVLRSTLAVHVGAYDGYAVTFQPDVPEGQRTAVRQTIEQSSVVFRVFRSRIPKEIQPEELAQARPATQLVAGADFGPPRW